MVNIPLPLIRDLSLIFESSSVGLMFYERWIFEAEKNTSKSWEDACSHSKCKHVH